MKDIIKTIKEIIKIIIFYICFFILTSILVLIGMLIYAGYSPHFSLHDITFDRVQGLTILFFIPLLMVLWIYIRITCEHEWEYSGIKGRLIVYKCKQCGETEKRCFPEGENSN